MRKKEFGIILPIICLMAACSKEPMNVNQNQKNEPHIVFQDSFSTNQGWTTATQADFSYRFNNGKYEIKVDKDGWLAWAYAPYSNGINFNYSIKVDCLLQLDDNTKVAMTGFIFNYIDNNNYCVALITNNGLYKIFQIANGTYSSIKDWTNTQAINITAGSNNTLEIDQKQSTIEFRINNQLIGAFANNKANVNVKVGLVAGTTDNPYFSRIVVSYDNFILSVIQ